MDSSVNVINLLGSVLVCIRDSYTLRFAWWLFVAFVGLAHLLEPWYPGNDFAIGPKVGYVVFGVMCIIFAGKGQIDLLIEDHWRLLWYWFCLFFTLIVLVEIIVRLFRWIRTSNIKVNWSRLRRELVNIVALRAPEADVNPSPNKGSLWTMVGRQFTLTTFPGNDSSEMKVSGFFWNKFDEALVKGMELLGQQTAQGTVADILAHEDTCIVCWDLFTSGSEVAVLPCGHIYHLSCAGDWFQRSLTCPKCRQQMEWRLAACET